MTEKTECKITIAINEDGTYQVGIDAGEASHRLRDETTCYAIRTINLTLQITPAQIENVPAIDIPDTAGTTRVEVEAA